MSAFFASSKAPKVNQRNIIAIGRSLYAELLVLREGQDIRPMDEVYGVGCLFADLSGQHGLSEAEFERHVGEMRKRFRRGGGPGQ